MTHITLDMLRSLTVSVPSPELQRQIADFLDEETGRIEALRTQKVQVIDLASERAQACLLHATLNGWVQGPRVPLKRIAQRLQTLPARDAEIITAYRDGQVTTRSSRRAEGYTLAEDESSYQAVSKGDLVFHGLDGFAGAVGIADTAGKCSPVYHVCRIEAPNVPKFFAYQLRALALAGYVELQASSVRQRAVDLRNWDRFGSIEVTVPHPNRQSDLSRSVESARRWSDAAIGALEEQVRLLDEHRQALVEAVITGDLDISKAA